jgi:hypothetical protein
MFCSRLTTVDSNSSTAALSMGIAAGSPITQYAIANYSRSGVGLPSTRKNANNNYIITTIDTGLLVVASLSSFDADGFTINIVSTGGQQYYVYYIAIKTAANIYLGHSTLNNTVGNQAISGLGIAPETGIFFSNCNNTLNAGSVVGDNEASIGFADYALSVFNTHHIDVNGISQTRNWNYQSNIHLYTNYNYDGTPTPLLYEQAMINSWDADGFTLQVETAGVTPNYLLYLLLGGTTPPPPADDSFGLIV